MTLVVGSGLLVIPGLQKKETWGTHCGGVSKSNSKVKDKDRSGYFPFRGSAFELVAGFGEAVEAAPD
jgi:hypothetical protein